MLPIIIENIAICQANVRMGFTLQQQRGRQPTNSSSIVYIGLFIDREHSL